MSTLTQTLFTEIESAPEPVQREVLDFVVFLKTRSSAAQEGMESLLPLAGRAWDAPPSGASRVIASPRTVGGVTLPPSSGGMPVKRAE